jgi:osmotically-inducible protein OsmY
MRSRSRLTPWIGAVALAAFTIACSNTGEGLKEDAAENRERAEEAAADARDSAGEAASKAEDALDRAADATAAAGRAAADAAATAGRTGGDAAGTAGRTIDAATQTADVKAALMADKTVDAGDINVDTNGDTRVLTLKGHVPTAAQKTRAGEIAAEKAPGYKIENRLEVRK